MVFHKIGKLLDVKVFLAAELLHLDYSTVHPRRKRTTKIHDRLEGTGNKPEEHYLYAGFVNCQTILDAQKKDISLEGPSAGRSQSFEVYQ